MKLVPGSLPALCCFLYVVSSSGEGRVLTWQTFQRVVSDDDAMSAIPVDTPVLGTEHNVVDDAIGAMIASALGPEYNAVDSDSGAVIEASLDNLVGGCSHGKCNFCTHAKYFKVCLDADVLSNGIQLEVTIDGHKIFKTQITVPDPKPICLSHFPGFLKEISDICLVIDDVNLKELSACVKIDFTVKIGFLHHKFSVKIHCFKIPHEQQPWDGAIEDKSDDQNERTPSEVKDEGHALADGTTGPAPMMVLMEALQRVSQIKQ